jgi:putative peptidoglycan lipid II flippase
MINRFFQKVNLFYNQKQTTLYASTMVVSATLIIARILGIVKLHILTNYYTSRELDLFFAAFRLPDFIFEILIAGSVGTCFIPIVSELISKGQSKKEIMIFSQSLIILFLAAWLFLFVVLTPFYYQLSVWLMPGYSAQQIQLISQMSWYILLIQVPFLLIANIYVAVLQTEKQFFIPGVAPVFYNLGIIVGVMIFAKTLGLQAALVGVALGAVLYLIVVLPGPLLMRYPLVREVNVLSSQVRRFLKMFFPRLFSSVVAQIDATVDLALATLTATGGYSAFYLAKNVQIIPVSFLGIALSQTALPFFSDFNNDVDRSNFMKMFLKLIFEVFFIVFPLAMLMVVLRTPFIRLLFGGSKFDWPETVATANTLSVFALSLPFHTVYYLITRAFFAFQDSKTPFVVSFICTLLNTALSVTFVYLLHLPVWYLALAFGLAITVNTSVLFYLLVVKLDHIQLWATVRHFLVLLFITLISGLVVWGFKRITDGLIFDTSRTINLFFLTGSSILIGSLVYLYLAWFFLPADLQNCYLLLTRLELVKKTIIRYRKIFYSESLSAPIQEKI